MARVAFIGGGAMGAPMAGHLLAAGHSLVVFTRRRAAADALVERGAEYAASPAAAATGAEFVFLSVTGTRDVEDVVLGTGTYAGSAVLDGAAAGTVVCDTSTIDAGATRRMAAVLRQRDILLLDCPVSGGAAGAQAATLTVLVGGDGTALEKARPLLECLGQQIFHMGDSGAGQITKACNQIAQVVNIQGIAEALL
ncbi:MAG: NAD(P)-dependent oxidoreductase, partial [Gammaproteobacteria bacterium]|nr:NAD(P)-dependent oxidoreductase [Gammaproteobacteria bacterium]